MSFHRCSSELPVEVWERVIDKVSGITQPDFDRIVNPMATPNIEDFPSFNTLRPIWWPTPTLLHCCLVCHMWVPRARFNLYRNIIIYSRTGLAAILFTISNRPSLTQLIRHIMVAPDSVDQSWVSTAPLLLGPKLDCPRLVLNFHGLDFAQLHPEFPRSCTLFRRKHGHACNDLQIIFTAVLNPSRCDSHLQRFIFATQPSRVFLHNDASSWPSLLSPSDSLYTSGTRRQVGLRAPLKHLVLSLSPDRLRGLTRTWVPPSPLEVADLHVEIICKEPVDTADYFQDVWSSLDAWGTKFRHMMCDSLPKSHIPLHRKLSFSALSSLSELGISSRHYEGEERISVCTRFELFHAADTAMSSHQIALVVAFLGLQSMFPVHFHDSDATLTTHLTFCAHYDTDHNPQDISSSDDWREDKHTPLIGAAITSDVRRIWSNVDEALCTHPWFQDSSPPMEIRLSWHYPNNVFTVPVLLPRVEEYACMDELVAVLLPKATKMRPGLIKSCTDGRCVYHVARRQMKSISGLASPPQSLV
ncbi:hypothetical protein BXZ70DRAFT_673223 [Cristinia sonorae]|uniref:Uncharacterized protein n=1 Tax=Cristinia sonorae TaxID=1940300 RepID=A0A8K0UV52_9AGAR|nr:hypothetical protein BXZ70DRAFT_673223 [Cristinia sonorae]